MNTHWLLRNKTCLATEVNFFLQQYIYVYTYMYNVAHALQTVLRMIQTWLWKTIYSSTLTTSETFFPKTLCYKTLNWYKATNTSRKALIVYIILSTLIKTLNKNSFTRNPNVVSSKVVHSQRWFSTWCDHFLYNAYSFEYLFTVISRQTSAKPTVTYKLCPLYPHYLFYPLKTMFALTTWCEYILDKQKKIGK